MDKTKTFKLSEITKIFGVKRHFIIHLVEAGIIKPLMDAKGRGKSRKYSYENLIQIGVFIYLNKLKLSYGMAKSILSHLYGPPFGGQTAAEMVIYICVIGLASGEMKVDVCMGHIRGESEPGEYLADRIQWKAHKDKSIRKEDFVYYYILDVHNIRNYIDSMIRKI